MTEVDITPPEFTNCPDLIRRTLTPGTTSLQVYWIEPTATDNSGIEPTVDKSHVPGDIFAIGITQVIYNFTDHAGNRATCTFTVEIGQNLLLLLFFFIYIYISSGNVL